MTAQAAERKALGEGLAKLNENMVTMAEMSVLAIRTASAGLVSPREAQAEAVFTLDQEIYGMREEVVKGCVDLIALHAPVARDLRTITMSLETTTDLDRIGRYARDIAEVSQRLGRDQGPKSRLDGLSKMVDLTVQMVNTAVEAFVHRDAEPVRHIEQDDDAVDQLHDELFTTITDRMTARSMPVAVGAQLILVNRYLERIADHAVNIGEHTIYMVTGQRASHVMPRTGGNARPA